MTNYEKQKTEIDATIERGICIAVNKSTKKVVLCPEIACAECLFFKSGSAGCGVRMMEWLVAEYEEPEIDWGKTPVDTPVLASMDRGNTYVYSYGRTSWSSKTAYDGDTVKVSYIKLAEVENND